MDFETPDGSQFFLRELWDTNANTNAAEDSDEHDDGDDKGALHFQGTLITGFVDGRPYAGLHPSRLEAIDEMEAMENLEAVPPQNVFPLFPLNLRRAPPFDPQQHYLKAPQFTLDDTRPGQTFVAECLLREAEVLQRLQTERHAGIVEFLGCVVREDRITQLCLKRYKGGNLVQWLNGARRSEAEAERVLAQVRAAVRILHSLDLAHNDINPENVCIDAKGDAVLVDFDACRNFGEPLVKGSGFSETEDEPPKSDPRNDLDALEDLEDFVRAFT